MVARNSCVRVSMRPYVRRHACVAANVSLVSMNRLHIVQWWW